MPPQYGPDVCTYAGAGRKLIQWTHQKLVNHIDIDHFIKKTLE